MKKEGKRQAIKRHIRHAVRGGTTRLTEVPLVPPHQHNADEGVLRPETGNLKLPAGLIDAGNPEGLARPGLIVLIITALAAVFIGVIAWLVAQMPEK